MTKASVLILSAGFSERMKINKFSLKFNEENNFLQEIVNKYKKNNIYDIVVVMNDKNIKIAEENNYYNLDCKFVVNRNAEKGRLTSIREGLKAVKYDFCFIHNIDNPFVIEEVIEKLFLKRDKADYISPRYKSRGGHPVLISENVKNKILDTNSYDITLKEILKDFNRFSVDVNNKEILININNQEEYKRYFDANN